MALESTSAKIVKNITIGLIFSKAVPDQIKAFENFQKLGSRKIPRWMNAIAISNQSFLRKCAILDD